MDWVLGFRILGLRFGATGFRAWSLLELSSPIPKHVNSTVVPKTCTPAPPECLSDRPGTTMAGPTLAHPYAPSLQIRSNRALLRRGDGRILWMDGGTYSYRILKSHRRTGRARRASSPNEQGIHWHTNKSAQYLLMSALPMRAIQWKASEPA